MQQRLLVRDRAAVVAGREQDGIGVVVGDVFGQFQVRGAGAFFLGAAECFAHTRRDVVRGNNLARVLGQRFHHVDDIDNLEMSLLGRLDRLLSGDHQHRHAAELAVGGGGDEVGRARAECGQTHTGFAGESAVGRGHEPGSLFVTGQDQLDRRGAQRFEQIEIFLAGNTEHVVHMFGFQGFDEQLRSFHQALLH